MDPADYYKSITLELDALKSRIRYLINDRHWQTDGEWKESVLRTVIKRHMPNTIGVGRGFIIDKTRESSQIDILLYDQTLPVLHRDGDLVFITPDAVRGIIEMKTTIKCGMLDEVLGKLIDNADIVPDRAVNIFLGLFAYESDLGSNPEKYLLSALQAAASNTEERAVNHVCAGRSLFARYWSLNPYTKESMQKWFSYNVQDIAPGYFLANALESTIGQPIRDNLWAWFPSTGKDIYKSGEISLR